MYSDSDNSLETVGKPSSKREDSQKRQNKDVYFSSPTKTVFPTRPASTVRRRARRHQTLSPPSDHPPDDLSESSRIDTIGDVNSLDSPSTSRSSAFSRIGTPQVDQLITTAVKTRIRSRLQARERASRSRTPTGPDGDLDHRVRAILSSKETWRNTIADIVSSDTESLQLDASKSVDFFTRPSVREICSNEKDTRAKITEESNSDVNSKVNPVSDTDILEDRLTSIKNLFVSSEDLECCHWQKPFLRPKKEILERESAILTNTSGKPLPKSIIYAREEGFDPERDGIYLDPVPSHLSKKNIHKLNERLYRDSGKKWFSECVYFVHFFLNQYFTWWSRLFTSIKNTMTDDSLYDYQLITSRQRSTLLQTKSNAGIYELVVKVMSFRFFLNPLMTEEHIAAAKLVDFYDQYKKFLPGQSHENLRRQIEMIKSNIDAALSNRDLKSVVNNQQTQLMESRIAIYKKHLAKAYTEWTSTLKKWRLIQLSILACWKEVQQKRQNQQFVSTPIRLSYKEEISEVDEQTEKKEWLRNVEERFNFERMMQKEAHEKMMDEYRKKLRLWRNSESQQRSDLKLEPIDNSNESIDSKLISVDGRVVTKPDPPTLMLDDTELLQTIKDDTYLSDGRLPGEPKFVDFEILYDYNMTSTKECPATERKRRSKANQLRFVLEVHCDNVMVKTLERKASNSFQINWDQKLSIGLTHLPEKIKMVLVKQGNMSRPQLSAELKVPVDVNLSQDECLTEHVKFIGDSSEKLYEGKLEYLSFWRHDEASNLKVPPEIVSRDLQRHGKDVNKTDYEKFMSEFDPNDAETIHMNRPPYPKKRVVFRDCEGDYSEACGSAVEINPFEFVKIEELENNPRFKMIRSRAKGDSLVKGLPVPLSEREISNSLFALKDESEESLNKSQRGIEAKRQKAVAILTKVRNKLMSQAENVLDRPRAWEDLIIEQESLGLKMSFHLLLPTFKKRPLNPSRKERKKVISLASNAEVRLIITVMRGLNVPIRSDIEKKASKVDPGIGEISYESKVNPFVEVVFQRQVARTSRAEGAQPTWNETLLLGLKVPNDDFSPSQLSSITDIIYLNLYDEVVSELNESLTDSASISQRFERRWLGSIKIPFSTLYLNSKIEGVFRLNTPPVLFGYDYDSQIFNLGQSISPDSANATNTYLTLFLTIDPTLQCPEQYTIKCDSMESERVLQHSKQWEIRRKHEHPDRPVRALAVDLNAQFVLVTRYISPIKPPDELMASLVHTDEVIYRVARFVSLIPSVPDNIALPGLGDIWYNCSQFLEMLVGDQEEHAILLCNFFLHLGKRAGIVIGSGIPEGSTAYVIVWEFVGHEPSLWNPVTGERFHIRDSHIPLHTVGTIFTNDNVYANVQKQVHPNRLNFDIHDSSHWKPLFNRKFANPGLSSVQSEIEFEPTDQEYVDKLQNDLEKILRESLMRWRKTSKTFFNRAAIHQISKILPSFEKRLGKIQQNDLIQDFAGILAVQKMIGFPLNMPYTSMDAVLEAVYATGVHLVDEKDATFAIAVYLHPYPCNVISVWVYIAALLRAE